VAVAPLTLCVLTRLLGQDPVRTLPLNYSLEFENAAVRVVRAHYGPREKLPVHEHSRFPTVYVYLADSPPVRFRHEEANAFELVRPALKQGMYRVSPGRREVHTVENLGDAPSDFLRVELKRIPLGIGNLWHRGNHPFDLTQSSARVEYSRPQLEIERIICAGPEACEVVKRHRASLLVALSAVASGNSELKTGDVQWLPAGEPVRLSSRNETAHVLRIMLPE
jgi:hypothetical protein